MQHIVVIEQSDIIPCGHLNTGVGIVRDPQILFQLAIPDAVILLDILFYTLSHLGMLIVASVRQT